MGLPIGLTLMPCAGGGAADALAAERKTRAAAKGRSSAVLKYLRYLMPFSLISLFNFVVSRTGDLWAAELRGGDAGSDMGAPKKSLSDLSARTLGPASSCDLQAASATILTRLWG